MFNEIKNFNKKEFAEFIKNNFEQNPEPLFAYADRIRQQNYEKKVYIRGLIEFTNYCKNKCYYCGINSCNKNIQRYRLSKSEILDCCESGYNAGIKTFVLQGGEDNFFNDDIISDIIYSIKSKYPDCAVTLSMGEKSKQSYKKYYDSGADRYLLRHETADKFHYYKLHPHNMSYENRIKCLYILKEIGFQTGAGFMVGSPYQTYDNLADDLLFIKQLKPQMVGIGPFIPHNETKFSSFKAGNLILTLIMLSITRIILPNVLLPSTTALATVSDEGRLLGIKSGCNVIMPNLSPVNYRNKYSLYNNKVNSNSETLENLKQIKKQLESIGYEMDLSKGDYKNL